MRGYRLEQDTATFVRANSRVPDMMIGDLTAKAGVCHTIGEARLHDLIAAYGAPALLQQFDQAGERTAHRIREQLDAWPDGVCEVEAMVDDPSIGEPIRMHVASIKEGRTPRPRLHRHRQPGDRPHQPPPALRRGASPATWRYASPTAISPSTTAWRTPSSAASGAAASSIPRSPGPVGFYSKTLALAESVIGAVMAKASGRPALAHIATQSSIVVGYTGARRQYVQYELMYAGAPAWEGGDGFSGVGSRASYGAKFTSVEVIESEFPVDMTRFEVLPDSGGDGAYRGGPGYVREYRVRAPSRLSGGASKREAAGVEGGGDGRNAWVVVHPGEEREQRYPGIVSNVGLEPGDVFRIETGGGRRRRSPPPIATPPAPAPTSRTVSSPPPRPATPTASMCDPLSLEGRGLGRG